MNLDDVAKMIRDILARELKGGFVDEKIENIEISRENEKQFLIQIATGEKRPSSFFVVVADAEV